jgi:4-carboxymuconolactone decarboxylase
MPAKKKAAAKKVVARKKSAKKAAPSLIRRSAAYKAGLKLRKKVVGPNYVKRSLKNVDDLNFDFQEVVTGIAWGQIWTRKGLSLRDRSLLTLAFCIALNRPHEIEIHLRGAIRNGVTRTELRELLLHSFVYCGGPAAMDAIRTVRETIGDIEREEGKRRR